jgi:hypothetical protein
LTLIGSVSQPRIVDVDDSAAFFQSTSHLGNRLRI